MSPARRRRRPGRLPAHSGTVVLDADGLSKCTGNVHAAAVLRLLIAKGWDVATVAPVLVEALRGDRADARVNRLLAAEVEIHPVDERAARQAAPLRAQALRAANPSAVDALVATLAINTEPSAVILTSDPGDIEVIVSGQPNVNVIAV
jgi:predicted nucleic acid-binding protein